MGRPSYRKQALVPHGGYQCCHSLLPKADLQRTGMAWQRYLSLVVGRAWHHFEGSCIWHNAQPRASSSPAHCWELQAAIHPSSCHNSSV